jgi:ribosomal protein L37AE/L43A
MDRRPESAESKRIGAANSTGAAWPAGEIRGSAPSHDCCDRCGSVRLIRVKACWRCEACGYKSDCNGW